MWEPWGLSNVCFGQYSRRFVEFFRVLEITWIHIRIFLWGLFIYTDPKSLARAYHQFFQIFDDLCKFALGDPDQLLRLRNHVRL